MLTQEQACHIIGFNNCLKAIETQGGKTMSKKGKKQKAASQASTGTTAPTSAKAEDKVEPKVETKAETKVVAKVEPKTKELPKSHPVFRLENAVAKATKGKKVNNGIGYWIGNVRILKKGKAFPEDSLLFPRPNVKDLVKGGKMTGKMTPKNVALVKVTDANFDQLLKLVNLSIIAAKDAMTARTAKKTKAKAEAAKKAAETKAPVKEIETPTQAAKQAAA